MTLGILTQKLGSPVYSLVTQGIIKAMSKTSYFPIFSDGQWNPHLEEEGLKTLVDRQVDGLRGVGVRVARGVVRASQNTPSKVCRL